MFPYDCVYCEIEFWWLNCWPEILILSEYWTTKTVVNKTSEFNIHRMVQSKPKAINIPCLKNSKFEIAGASSLNIRTCKNYWDFVTMNFELTSRNKLEKKPSDLDKRKKYEKSHKFAEKSVSRKKKWKGSVLVVLAQNLFYNWCLFYTNLSSEISIEN